MYSELDTRYPHGVHELEVNFGRLDIPKPPVDIDYLHELTRGDKDLEQLYGDMLNYFYAYTEVACQYVEFQYRKDAGQVDKEEVDAEEAQLDANRRHVHNAAIDSVTILARALNKCGRDSTWIKKLPPHARALYGNMALATTFKTLLTEKQQGEPSHG